MTDVVTIGDATLYHGDCIEVMKSFPPCFGVDAIITDPPFGVGNFIQTSGNLTGKSGERGKPVDWNDSGPPEVFFEYARRLSKDRIIWGANFFNCFEKRGGAIVWYKHQKMPNFSKCDIASISHLQKTEYVSIPWTNFTRTHKGVSEHPCERPVELYEWCIDYLPNPTSIMDPFMGSGSCGVAAIRMGKSFIGIERERKWFDVSCERIEAAYAQGRLFA